VSEGTQLNTGTGGDYVSDEDISQEPRLGGVVPSIPLGGATGVKLERTKSAVGPFGADWGDAGQDNGLPVSDQQARLLLEYLVMKMGPPASGHERVQQRDAELSTNLLLVELIDTLRKMQLNTAQRSHGCRFTAVSANAGQTAYTALAANPMRQGAMFSNDANTASAANVYLILVDGSAPTTPTKDTNSVQLVPGAYFELPFGFTGRIDCIWDGTAGQLNITEVM